MNTILEDSWIFVLLLRMDTSSNFMCMLLEIFFAYNRISPFLFSFLNTSEYKTYFSAPCFVLPDVVSNIIIN